MSSRTTQLRLFALRRPYRPVLVSAGTAMQVLGQEHTTVMEMVDTGELRWVFDVATGSECQKRRELRFWLGELLAPAAHADKSVGDVVTAVVGHELSPQLRGHTVCNLLRIARPHLKRLVVTGELGGDVTGRVRWIERTSLCDFLQRRLVN